MFLAIRELRSARWRFALIGAVVFLLSLLVAGLLSLTAGLTHQSVSALQALSEDGDSYFAVPSADGEEANLDRAALSPDQIDAVKRLDPAAIPVGISRVQVEGQQKNAESAVAFGLQSPVGELTPPATGEALLPNKQAAAVSIGGLDLIVPGQVQDLWYSHTPVLVTDLETWQNISPRSGAATILALGSKPDAAIPGMEIVSGDELVEALPAHRAENSSLTTMTVMLMVISALVVGAFFAVWGIQRRGDVAVLKALGASTRTVVVDSLGQAGFVLGAGVGLGVLSAAALGQVASGKVPYVVSLETTLWPAAALIVLGLVGAAISLRPIITAEPSTALGSLR